MAKSNQFGGVSRPLDAIYDETYHVSDQRDHTRNISKGVHRIMDVKYEPVYETMFTDFRNHPRNLVTWQAPPNLPTRQLNEASQLLNRESHNNIAANKHVSCTGMDRYKYESAPANLFRSIIPSDTVLVMGAANQNLRADSRIHNTDYVGSRARTIGTQTIYRESEAQTDPYSPEYVLTPGAKPEILKLAALTYGHGLPAGVHEVEMILRQRYRNQIESTLPKLKDICNYPAKIAERRKILNDLDAADWAYREKEIDEIQDQRMKILISLLQKREKNIHILDSRRLNNLWDIKRSENAKFVEKVRHLLLRKLRKLQHSFHQMCPSGPKNIICDYADCGSEVYAPLMRNGQFLDKNAHKFQVKSPYLETVSGLMELEEFMLKKNFLDQEIKCPQPISNYTKSGHKKAAYRYQLEMLELEQYFDSLRNPKPKENKTKNYLTRIEKPVPLLPTPTFFEGELETEELDALVTEIQNAIRGRADQIRYYRGKEKRKDLIKELRSTHTLLDEDAKLLGNKLNLVRTAQAQHTELLEKFEIMNQELTRYEGSVTAEMLDLLSKEMLRLLEEQKGLELANKAKLERRMNEAKESGRRQIEERRRREHEEMFKQIVKVHQDTSDRYLDDLFKYTIETTANVMAEDESQRLAEELHARDIEASQVNSELRANEVASELIRNFLIPHVDRLTQKYLTSLKEKPFLQAAHKQVLEAGRLMVQDRSSSSDTTTNPNVSDDQTQTETEASSL